MSLKPDDSAYPELPEVEELCRRGQWLRRAFDAGEPEARRRVEEHAPPWTRHPDGALCFERLSHVDANQVVARELGYGHWGELINSYERPPEPLFEQAIDMVVEGRAKALRRLLREHPDLVRARSSRRHRAALVHYVASNGVEDEKQNVPANAVEIAEILFDAGADPDALAATYDGSRSQTPLYLHVSSSHPREHGLYAPLVRAFCQAGAKANGLDDDGLPLDTAIQFGHPEAAEALMECGARVDNVVFAAALGRIDVLETGWGEGRLPRPEFCRRRARVWPFASPYDSDPAAVSELERPDPASVAQEALLYAAMHGRVEAVRFLLARDVDAGASPFRNETALHWAAFQGHLEIVSLLLDRGADATSRDQRWFCTPVGWALESDQQPIVGLLRDRAELDLLDAAELGLIERVRVILAEDPGQADGPLGRGIPLRAAAHRGHLKVVQALLDAGADTTLTNPDGKSALDWAVEQGHDEVAALLRRA